MAVTHRCPQDSSDAVISEIHRATAATSSSELSRLLATDKRSCAGLLPGGPSKEILRSFVINCSIISCVYLCKRRHPVQSHRAQAELGLCSSGQNAHIIM